jgi:hypothetical protein
VHGAPIGGGGGGGGDHRRGGWFRSRAELLTLLHQPLLFWTAPLLAPIAMPTGDSRPIRVDRPSPKLTYLFMLVAFALLLATQPLPTPQVSSSSKHRRDRRHRRPCLVSVLAAGLGCGMVHHAALFAHGMRGYTSLPALIVTLTTEWPALIAAEAYLRTISIIHKYPGRNSELAEIY